MPDDLYHANLNSIAGSDLHQSIIDFVRVNRPKEERPTEGYLLDFKKEIGDKFIRVVASLANTFGGLIILGVDDDDHDGRPDHLVGVVFSGELKTHVANLIGSNLVPCPMFDVAECTLPSDQTKKLCVVRVRETQEVCLITKKAEKNPVYVRVEDRSEPADASALRALLERKRQNQNLTEELRVRLAKLRGMLELTRQDSFGGRVLIQTFLRILLCPNAHPLLPLDIGIEQNLTDLVLSPSLVSLVELGDAKTAFQRSRDWFEIGFHELHLDYSRRWLLTERADLGFVTQTKWPMEGTEGLWSLYDLTRDLITHLELAKEFWRMTGYYGGFQLDAELQVRDLKLSISSQGFEPLFYQRISQTASVPLLRAILAVTERPQPVGHASLDCSYSDLNLFLDEIVTGVLNQLLRSLGHGSELKKLKGAVRSLIA